MCCDCMTSSVNVNVPILVIAIDGRGLLENLIEENTSDIRGREWFGSEVPSSKSSVLMATVSTCGTVSTAPGWTLDHGV